MGRLFAPIIQKERESMIDYKKLTDDLIKAKESALSAIKNEDGGTANLDCMTIKLPRYNEEKVIAAVKEAGLYTRGKREWLGTRYFIHPPVGSMGNDRCRQVTAMCRVMESLGYSVLMFEQTD